MDSVLAAFFVMFLMIFGVLTLTDEFVGTQTTVEEAWQAMEARREDQYATRLVAQAAHTTENGTVLHLTLDNSGASKVADFARWDVFVQYMDDALPTGYHIDRLAYTPNDPALEGWSISQIYLGTEGQPEFFETGILNPGESAILRVRLAPALGPDQAALVNVALPNGITFSYTFARSALPVLTTNVGLNLASGESADVSNTVLAATDPDNGADELTYTVTALPIQGTLSMTSFTQADIDTNLVTYTHTGTGSDVFEFTLTDGENVVGPSAFVIIIGEPPTLTVNNGLTLTVGGSAPIAASSLAAADPDNSSAELVYHVTTLPSQGTLSQTTFTQADIEGGLVTYTHTGTSSDSFQFTLTDGLTTLGPLTFSITVN